LQEFADGAPGLIDSLTRVRVGAGIGIGDGDFAEWLVRDGQPSAGYL
jgi:hypothetical protein